MGIKSWQGVNIILLCSSSGAKLLRAGAHICTDEAPSQYFLFYMYTLCGEELEQSASASFNSPFFISVSFFDCSYIPFIWRGSLRPAVVRCFAGFRGVFDSLNSFMI